MVLKRFCELYMGDTGLDFGQAAHPITFSISTEVGLEINAEKSINMFMSCHQNAGNYHNVHR